MNNSIVDTVLSRAELLALILPVFPLSVIGIVVNGVIVYLYVRYKTLRAEGGFHMMALLALFDLLHSATALQVRLSAFSPKSNANIDVNLSPIRALRLARCRRFLLLHCWRSVGGGGMIMVVAAQLANVALCWDR